MGTEGGEGVQTDFGGLSASCRNGQRNGRWNVMQRKCDFIHFWRKKQENGVIFKWREIAGAQNLYRDLHG